MGILERSRVLFFKSAEDLFHLQTREVLFMWLSDERTTPAGFTQ